MMQQKFWMFKKYIKHEEWQQTIKKSKHKRSSESKRSQRRNNHQNFHWRVTDITLDVQLNRTWIRKKEKKRVRTHLSTLLQVRQGVRCMSPHTKVLFASHVPVFVRKTHAFWFDFKANSLTCYSLAKVFSFLVFVGFL